MRATASALVACALCAVAPATARAGGMEVGDNGAEAMGRGGAFVAKADSPAALNYNPAGFAKLRGWQTVVSANLVHAPVDFQRSGRFASANGDGLYPMVQNSSPWFAVPMQFALTTDFGISRRLTFAVGAYGPSAVGRSFERSLTAGGKEVAAPQRFDSVSGTGGSLLLFPTVGFGLRLHEKLDVGLTFQWALTKVQMSTMATVGAACPDSPEDPACDVAIEVEGKDWFAPSGSAGILFRPIRGLELGAMLRLPSTAELTGKAKVAFGPGVQKLAGYMQKKLLDPEEPTVTITNSYPWMVRLGGRYVWFAGAEERADLELDFVYERWSAVSKKSVSIDAVSLGKQLAPVDMDWKLKDTIGVRAGGSYRFRLGPSLHLTARAGAFAETESTAISDTSLSILGPQRIGLTAGLGLKWGAFSVDVAYAHLFLPQRVVERSTLSAQDFGGGKGPVVGNGTYRTAFDGLYFQLTTAFGGGGAASPRRRHAPAELELAQSKREGRALASAAAAQARSKDAPDGRAASGASGEALDFDPRAAGRATSRPAGGADPYRFDGERIELGAGGGDAYSFEGERVSRSKGKGLKRGKPGRRGHKAHGSNGRGRYAAGPATAAPLKGKPGKKRWSTVKLKKRGKKARAASGLRCKRGKRCPRLARLGH